MKYFSLFNIGCRKYLNISIDANNLLLSKLVGEDSKLKFVIRNISGENCIYLSHYLHNICLNVYSLPNNFDILIGAPDCDWCKFYVIKKNGFYLFQCFHREADINGNYGKYLCMNKDLSVSSKGVESDEYSMWKCESIE